MTTRAPIHRSRHLIAGLCLASLLTAPASSDEGMWLFNQPPLAQLKSRYGFEPKPEWLEHVRLSSVRFSTGGSGSLVSPDGLVMTNHHVAAETLQKLSTAKNDLLNRGFYAPNSAHEMKCEDLELNVLESIEDVTAQVQAAVKPGQTAAQSEQARRAVINEIESRSHGETQKNEVVTLFRGGAYHLYRYRRYSDVRLVFAPELGIAFFGGDPDNFEYPRHCLDVAFFRVYDKGRPARVKHFLKWAQGVQEGDLVFVSGHPGRTDRLNTHEHLRFFRDRSYPLTLNVLRRLEVMLNTFAERSQENARQAQDDRFGVQNSRKARLGGLQGLQDPALMARKLEEESALRKAVESDPALKSRFGDAWDQVVSAVREWDSFYPRYYLVELGRGFESRHFDLAREIVRYVGEREKPNQERLREYAESNWESLEQELFSPAPIYPGFEVAKLSDSLGLLVETLGAEDPDVTTWLAGLSPVERAHQLVEKTRLGDVKYRQQLCKLTLAQLRQCGDPMIELALAVEPVARPLRDRYEQKVAEPLQSAYAKVAQARLAVQKGEIYPDATFTLRLSFGKVAGYREQNRPVSHQTTLAGLFNKAREHSDQAPYSVPERWRKAKGQLNLSTPFNFLSTADIIGGNSGSPVVNRAGECVGLIFDSNLPALVLDFAYTDVQARALAVDNRAIVEALSKVYEAHSLVKELTGGAGHAHH